MDCACAEANVVGGGGADCECMGCATQRARRESGGWSRVGALSKNPSPPSPARGARGRRPPARRVGGEVHAYGDGALGSFDLPDLGFDPGAIWTGVPWVWGDPFPVQTTPCGWRLEARAVPLLDPNPCEYREMGIPVVTPGLGYYFRTGSTDVIRLSATKYRMYFAGAGSPRSPPIPSSPDRGRFWTRAAGPSLPSMTSVLSTPRTAPSTRSSGATAAASTTSSTSAMPTWVTSSPPTG